MLDITECDPLDVLRHGFYLKIINDYKTPRPF